MSDETQRVQDWHGTEIVKGTKVLYGEHLTPAIVIEISDADADYDDDLERAVMYPPKITLLFATNEVAKVTTYWNQIVYTEGNPMVFATDEMTVDNG